MCSCLLSAKVANRMLRNSSVQDDPWHTLALRNRTQIPACWSCRFNMWHTLWGASPPVHRVARQILASSPAQVPWLREVLGYEKWPKWCQDVWCVDEFCFRPVFTMFLTGWQGSLYSHQSVAVKWVFFPSALRGQSVSQGCDSYQSGASHHQLHLSLAVLRTFGRKFFQGNLHLQKWIWNEGSASRAQLFSLTSVFIEVSSKVPSPASPKPFLQARLLFLNKAVEDGEQLACETVELGHLGWDIYTPTWWGLEISQADEYNERCLTRYTDTP